MPCSVDAACLIVAMIMTAPAFTLAGKRIHSFAGPFTAYAKTFYLCDTGRSGEISWALRTSYYNPAKPNELQRLNGNMTLGPNGIGDPMWVNVIVDSRSNNQWKENAFVFKFNDKACTNIRSNIPDAYRGIFKKKTCPAPQGIYVLNEEPIKWTFPNIPVLPYGEYRFRMTLGKLDQLFGCLVVEGVVVPKSS